MSPIGETDLSSVRLLTNTGGTLHAPVLQRLRALFSHSDIVLNYGLTETYRSCYLPAHMLETHADSLGVPIPGVDVVIVREDGTIAAPGEHGEIVHRGDYICMGYWGDAENTSRALRDDPLAAGGHPASPRALFTGDIGYRSEEGLIYFVGRRDHQLKSMGVRVSPGEVEALLLQSGLLLEAAVYGLPHEIMGHEIRAAIVPRDAASFRLGDLQKHARESMSQYMMPRAYHKVANLPRTSTGKVDYEALRKNGRPPTSAGSTAVSLGEP
jgi:acyl-coenzyme A synthetase/AMP-(fatty) acid ligase